MNNIIGHGLKEQITQKLYVSQFTVVPNPYGKNFWIIYTQKIEFGKIY